MTAPQRIRLRRTKGWRKPEVAVVVARPSRWGNPYRVEDKAITYEGMLLWSGFRDTQAATAHAVRAFRWQIIHHPNVTGYGLTDVREQLGGHDLACWCPHDHPCHADVLLELANGAAS